MVSEWKQDPEFVAAYNDLETETAKLRKGLQTHQKSGLIQLFRQSPLHDVEIDLDRKTPLRAMAPPMVCINSGLWLDWKEFD